MTTTSEAIENLRLGLLQYNVTEVYLISGTNQISVFDAVQHNHYEMILALDSNVCFADYFLSPTLDYTYGYGYGYATGRTNVDTYFDVLAVEGYGYGFGDYNFQIQNLYGYGYGFGFEKSVVIKPKYKPNKPPFLYIPKEQLLNFTGFNNYPWTDSNTLKDQFFYESVYYNKKISYIIGLIYKTLKLFTDGKVTNG